MANTTFIATHESGAASEFTTDDQGHFKVVLEPGHYKVTRKGDPKGIGRCGPFDAFVVTGQITRQDWQCDSGMR